MPAAPRSGDKKDNRERDVMSFPDMRNTKTLAAMQAAFRSRWSPQDYIKRSEFETDLIELIYQVIHEAQQPLIKELADLKPWHPPPIIMDKKP